MLKQIVIDTNVFISALRSKRGASFRLLSLIGQSASFKVNVSVPLVLEYEDVANRYLEATGLASSDVEAIIDYICSNSSLRRIFFLWRPFLKDPKDDMVLELAVESQSEIIVSFNKKDFVGSEQFGVRVLTPREFLAEIGETL